MCDHAYPETAAIARDQPIMLIFLPIMLCCSAQIFDAHVKEF